MKTKQSHVSCVFQGVNGLSSVVWVFSLIVLLMKFCPLWIQVRRHGYSPISHGENDEDDEGRYDYVGPPEGQADIPRRQ